MRRIDSTELNVVGEQYDSIAEFYRINENRDFNPHYSSDYSCGKDSRRKVKPDVEYTWEQTQHDMMLGSDLFNAEFNRMLSEIKSRIPNAWRLGNRNRTKKDFVGQSISVGRALAGHPKSFNRQRPVRLKQKMVSIFFSISCPYYTSTEDRMRAGCIIMAICEHLEECGYQTRIMYSPDFSFGNRSGKWNDPKNPSQILQMSLKGFDTRFNLRKMQFPLASESALFHVGCWWNHRFPGTQFDWGYGEGYAVDNDAKRLESAMKFAKSQNAVYVSIPFIKNECNMDIMKVYDYIMGEIS